MTKEAFVRTVKELLLGNGEIHWNSVHESFLADLGRQYERGALSTDAVLTSLKGHFSYNLNRDLERQIAKTLR